METETKLLIAVGAAVTANCQPCLKTLLKTALENKVEEKDILEAINIAKTVRKNSSTQIDRFLSSIGSTDALQNATEGCGCK
jgi:AhpD family alkylhydroperoxidase